METNEMIEMMQGRQGAYLFLARCFSAAPDDAFFASILATPAEDESVANLANVVESLNNPEGMRDAIADFNALFLGMSAHPVAPYESVYTSDEHLLMQEARDQVLHLYKLFGCEVPKGFHHPEDHISMELEFMAVLCERAVAALKAGDAASAESFAAAQKAFLELHLNVWVRHMVADIEKRAATPLYPAFGKMLLEHIASDLAWL